MGYKLFCEEDVNKRRLCTYPNHYYFKLFIAYAHEQLTVRSRVLGKIMESFFDNMTQSERDKLIAKFDKLTDEQIERPNRF